MCRRTSRVSCGTRAFLARVRGCRVAARKAVGQDKPVTIRLHDLRFILTRRSFATLAGEGSA